MIDHLLDFTNRLIACVPASNRDLKACLVYMEVVDPRQVG